MIARATLALLVCAPALSAQGKLVFEDIVQDIGTVYQHHERQVEFPFTVEGGPVKLNAYTGDVDFHTSCGCTDAWLRADWLAEEGEEGPRWDLGAAMPDGVQGTLMATFRGERWSTTKKSTITLRGNMLGGPVILKIEAHVKRVFVSDPVELDFGEVMEAGTREEPSRLEVSVVGKESFAFLEWSGMPRGLSVEEVGEAELLDDGRMRRRLRFTLAGGAQPGSLTGLASAKTSLGVPFELPVSAKVLAAVGFSESRLHLGFPRQGDSVSRTVQVRMNRAGETLPEPHAGMDDALAEHFEVTVVAREAGRVYDVVVRSRESLPAGRHRGTLQVVFPVGSGLAGRDIPVSINVRSKAP